MKLDPVKFKEHLARMRRDRPAKSHSMPCSIVADTLRATAFWCSHCNRVCCWDCHEPDETIDEIKTIGSRYCDAAECRAAEAIEHGLPEEELRGIHDHWKNEDRLCRHRLRS